MNNEYGNLPACFLIFDVTGNWNVTSLRLSEASHVKYQHLYGSFKYRDKDDDRLDRLIPSAPGNKLQGISLKTLQGYPYKTYPQPIDQSINQALPFKKLQEMCTNSWL